MNATEKALPLVTDELEVLSGLVPLQGQRIIELGCGAAQMARALLKRFPGSSVTALEVDERQHAKNLASPQDGLHFVAAGAQAIPAPDASFDLAMMLKSLHHVPMPLLDTALLEAARVLRSGGHLYVSEPVYGGPFNEVIRTFNEEGLVRAEAQKALDRTLVAGPWEQVSEKRFEMPIRFASFDEFEKRHMRPTFADHKLDEAKIATARAAFMEHAHGDGSADFQRPMHIRLLRKKA